MALLAAWCAMRFGELAELRRGNMDLRHNRVNFSRAVVRPGDTFIVGSPKPDAGVRDLAVPPHLIPFVKAHLKHNVASGKNAVLVSAPLEGNAHMAPSTPYKVYYPAPEERRSPRPPLARPPLHGAVLAAQTGATLAELMERLGHSTPGAAMRCQHAAADRDAEFTRRLSAVVSEPSGTVAE